jgi:hypothetical protein
LKASLITLFYLLSLSHYILAQSASKNLFHPLSNAFGITIEVGGTVPKTDYKIDELDITGRLLLEYFFTSHSINAFGIRILGGGGYLTGQVFSNDLIYPPVPDNFHTEFLFMGGGLVYALNLGNSVPYISVSSIYISFNPLDENGYQLPNNQFSVYDKGAVLYSAEAGVRFPFSDKWSLNLGVNFNFSSTDYLDDIKAGNNNDAFIGFFTGVSFYLGKNIDTDNDGVADDVDLCPDTPEDTEVSEFGCSFIDLKSQEIYYDSLKDHFLFDGIFSDGNLFCFQVDVFQEKNSAVELQNEILSLGYKADIFKIKFGGRVWYSVRIGYFNSFDNARFYKDDYFKKTNPKLK